MARNRIRKATRSKAKMTSNTGHRLQGKLGKAVMHERKHHFCCHILSVLTSLASMHVLHDQTIFKQAVPVTLPHRRPSPTAKLEC